MVSTLEEKKKDLSDFRKNVLSADEFTRIIIHDRIKFLEELREHGYRIIAPDENRSDLVGKEKIESNTKTA